MLNQAEYLDVNGRRQFLSLRAQAEGLPLLLYLHGGPGDAALPLVSRYNRALEGRYTVAVWEQRGAGKSYYPFSPGEPLTIQTFADDLHCIVTHLLRRFHQEKIYLLGHSWGSVLGLHYLRQHPELIHTYAGCGQVVNMREGARRQYGFVLAECRRRGDHKALERLERIDPAYTGESWLDDLLFVTKRVVKYGGSLYGCSSYNRLVKAFLFSPEYSLRDLLNREKGALQSIRRLWPELMGVDFTPVTSYGAPVVFLEGRHDRHVSSALLAEYYETITSPKRLHWFERSCHFPQWSEADKFNSLLCAPD